jgi:SAM-dependent methyltransferase
MDQDEDTGSSPAVDFWERPEVVEEFAARTADHRLTLLVESWQDARSVRVLDLGCAGGRNTEFLAARGFDVYALDTSQAMVERTRRRLAPKVGEAEAQRRVAEGRMQNLGRFAAGEFDLVLSLGVYHNATGDAEFMCTLAETARVLKAGGRVLVALFSPRSRPKGAALVRLSRAGNLYAGFDSGPLYLLEPEELDSAMAVYGLEPAVPTATGQTATERGFRISVNGLYVKRA